MMAFIALSMAANAQWTLQANPMGSGDTTMLGKVQFVSATEGWIANGNNGSLLHTLNGGTTWNLVTPFPNDVVGNMSDPALSMSWVNPTHGWALKTFITGEGDISTNADGAVLYKTTDGGSYWAKKTFSKSITTTTYSTSDLQGTWQMHELVAANNTNFSSNSWAGWLHSTLTLDANGNGTFSGMTKSSDITNYPSSVSMSLSSVGTLSVGGDINGFMSTDKNTVYMTTTDGGGGYGLGVMQRVVSGVNYTTGDLQGTWQIHQLVTANPKSSNQYADWMYGTITMDASGNGICSFIKSGGSKSKNLAISISSNGTVLMSGTDFHGFMSADKKSISITLTDGSADGFDFMIMQKVVTGTSYVTSDLQGKWQTHILTTTNPSFLINQQSKWSQGVITLNANGEGKGIFTTSDNSNINNGSNDNSDSQNNLFMSISSDGLVTSSSGNGTDFHGYMSADMRSVFITATEDNGEYTFAVMQKDLSVSGDFGLQVQFVDNNNGWISIYNMIYGTFQLYKTTDGGSTWNPITTTTGGIYQFIDANNGWMIGSSVSNIGEGNLNSIYHTTNGGTSWTIQSDNIGTGKAIYFTDLQHGWVVGQDGLVLKTTDGGTNWNLVTNTGLTTGYSSKAVFFLDANNGWISGGNQNTEGIGTRFILATKDGGTTWTTQPTPVANDIYSLFFWDVNNGWLISDHGQIAHYSYTPPKTITISAGGLSAALTTTEKNAIKILTVKGTIDARDFKTLRDDMPLLSGIDLSQTTILAYSGTEGTYSTASTDYPANTIPRLAFFTSEGKSGLKSIILPNNLVSIGRSAFNKCSGLTSINIPSTVTSIAYAAFNYCSNLSSVNIPSSVTLIDSWTFGYCTNLISITIPSSVTSIGNSAFSYSGLKSITLANGVTSIGDYAFHGCSSLITASLPASVSHVGYCAFNFENAMTSFDVSGQNQYYSSLNGILYNKAQNKLVRYPGGLTNFIIPSGVTVIDTAAFEGIDNLHAIIIPSTVIKLSVEAFYWCTNLKIIDIPGTVTTIGAYAFYNCSGLTSITVHSNTPVNLSLSDSVFNFVDKSSCTLYVPSGTKASYQAANQWKDFKNIIELNYKTVNIVAGSLYSALTSTELSNTTNLKINGTIDARDFKTMRDQMALLSDLDISGVVILSYAGNDGPNDGYTVYGANAIPNHAFYTQMTNTGKTILHSIQLPPTLTTIEGAAFTASGLTEIILPDGITSVNDWAFAACKLNTVSIPASLSSIGLCAFAYNSSLQSFMVDANNPYFTNIDGVLFDMNQETIICYPNGRPGTTYQIPSGVITIDKSAFAGWCLEQVFIPATVTTLSEYAFYDCGNMRTIELPATINLIGESAFNNCTGLTSITVHSTYPVDLSSSSNVFLNVNKSTCTLYVPVGSKTLYQAAAQWKDFINIVEEENSVTYNVMVPAGTKACYIGGDMNNWTPQIMTKIDDQHYTITLQNANNGQMYKYCSGPDWTFVEQNADGSQVSDRSYAGNDVVVKWTAIYDPSPISMTYTVTVPIGTKACYLSGEMNGWSFIPMSKVDNTHFTISIFSSTGYAYKFCSGPSWNFVEVNADGSYDSNRSYSTTDVVVKWLAVFDPSTLTAADYYLPLNVGNYSQLHTQNVPYGSGWATRNTYFSFIRSESINGVPYLVEQDKEIADNNPNDNNVFGVFWLRKDGNGNVVAGAYSTSGNDNLSSAVILSTPAMIFPNQYLTAGFSQTFPTQNNETETDSVISVTATAGSFNNCIQVREINKTNGIIQMVEDSYYALFVGRVMQIRLFPANECHTDVLVNYIALSVTGLNDLKAGDNLTLYPNPVTDGFYLNTGEKNCTVTLYNLNGVMSFTKQIVNTDYINISGLPKGMYIVKIVTPDGTVEKKLVKK